MTLILLLLGATCFLAYSNGANDNFKGVATLFGSNTTAYKGALTWATVTTFAGSISALFLAETLVKRFSGKGLVPDMIAASPEFLLAVALGAGLTVMLATLLGFPISTTHSLTGALVGAGVAAVGMGVNFGVLGRAFVLPLLVSPLLAVVLAALGYLFFRYWRLRLGVTKETYVYVPNGQAKMVPAELGVLAFQEVPTTKLVVATESVCIEQYAGTLMGVSAQKILDTAHYLSAGIVSYARGLNDTPKIVGLLVVVQGLAIEWGMIAVGVAIAIGGLLNARKVAETMSKKITPLNPGQGFTANLVTGFMVVVASRFGVPVSTTHVSVGSLFGIGSVTKEADTRVVGSILLSWVLTLPIAAALSALAYVLI